MLKHINQSENNQVQLEHCKETILTMKKALIQIPIFDIDNVFSDFPIYKDFLGLMRTLKRINAIDSSGNINHTGTLEVDFFLDIIQKEYNEEDYQEYFDEFDEDFSGLMGRLESDSDEDWSDSPRGYAAPFIDIIETFNCEFIPLIVSESAGFNVDFTKTFLEPGKFFQKMIDLLTEIEPFAYEQAFEVLRAFEIFIEMNGLYDVKNKKLLIHQQQFTDSQTSIFIYEETIDLKSYYDPSFDILVEFCTQNNIAHNSERVAYYEQHPEQLQRVMFLKQLTKSFRASGYLYRQSYGSFNIHAAIEKIMLSDDEKTIKSIFYFFSEFLSSLDAVQYREDGNIFSLTYSPYDLLMLIGIHENLFGPEAECSDDVAMLTSKAYRFIDNSSPSSFKGPLSKDIDIKSLKSTLKRYYGVSV